MHAHSFIFTVTYHQLFIQNVCVIRTHMRVFQISLQRTIRFFVRAVSFSPGFSFQLFSCIGDADWTCAHFRFVVFLFQVNYTFFLNCDKFLFIMECMKIKKTLDVQWRGTIATMRTMYARPVEKRIDLMDGVRCVW